LELEPGTKLYLSKRDDEHILESVEYMCKRLKAGLKGRQPLAVLDIECASRGSYSFSKVQVNELLNTAKNLICGENQVPWLGWYALGEFGPVGNKNMYHHKTAIICVITRKNG
jgi:small ligand-binding sensory domain FIST